MDKEDHVLAENWGNEGHIEPSDLVVTTCFLRSFKEERREFEGGTQSLVSSSLEHGIS